MPNREMVNRKTAALVVEPDTYNDTFGSEYVDTQGYDAITFLVAHGDVTAAAGANNIALKLQSKNTAPGTAAGYVDVPAADLRGEFALLENDVDAGVQVVGYVGAARYLRLVGTKTGTAAADIGVVALGELSDRDPASEKTLTTGAVT